MQYLPVYLRSNNQDCRIYLQTNLANKIFNSQVEDTLPFLLDLFTKYNGLRKIAFYLLFLLVYIALFSNAFTNIVESVGCWKHI